MSPESGWSNNNWKKKSFLRIGGLFQSSEIHLLSLDGETKMGIYFLILQTFNFWMIKMTKTQILPYHHQVPNVFFCITVNFIIKELNFCQIKNYTSVSVSVVRSKSHGTKRKSKTEKSSLGSFSAKIICDFVTLLSFGNVEQYWLLSKARLFAESFRFLPYVWFGCFLYIPLP